MLKEVAISTIKLFGCLPGLIVALAALRKIGEETGFDKTAPKTYAKLSIWINTLLYILIEHWIACLLVSIFGGTVWALLVVEPKAAALRDFNRLRRTRLGE